MHRFTCLLFIAALAGMLTILDSRPANAQQGKYITEATVRLSKLVDAANKAGYSLQDNSFSIGGGWIQQSRDRWVAIFTVELQEGTKYRFLAAGDVDAQDVDIEVAQVGTNKIVARDVAEDPVATVDFTPQSTGRHVVRVRLYASANNVPCVCLAIVMSQAPTKN